eukprot:8631387-Pyramimonas_sp.AAC.1
MPRRALQESPRGSPEAPKTLLKPSGAAKRPRRRPKRPPRGSHEPCRGSPNPPKTLLEALGAAKRLPRRSKRGR